MTSAFMLTYALSYATIPGGARRCKCLMFSYLRMALLSLDHTNIHVIYAAFVLWMCT